MIISRRPRYLHSPFSAVVPGEEIRDRHSRKSTSHLRNTLVSLDLQPWKDGKMCLTFFKRRAPPKEKANKAIVKPSPVHGKSISRPIPIPSHCPSSLNWMNTSRDQTETCVRAAAAPSLYRANVTCAEYRDLGRCLGGRGRMRDSYRIEAMDEADGEMPTSGGQRLIELEQFALALAFPAPPGYDADQDEVDAPLPESSDLWSDPETLARLEGRHWEGR